MSFGPLRNPVRFTLVLLLVTLVAPPSNPEAQSRAAQPTKQKLVTAANRMLPIFVEHALWRPPERAWIGRAMHSRDVQRLREDLDDGVRLANSLGLDVSDVELPY